MNKEVKLYHKSKHWLKGQWESLTYKLMAGISPVYKIYHNRKRDRLKNNMMVNLTKQKKNNQKGNNGTFEYSVCC